MTEPSDDELREAVFKAIYWSDVGQSYRLNKGACEALTAIITDTIDAGRAALHEAGGPEPEPFLWWCPEERCSYETAPSRRHLAHGDFPLFRGATREAGQPTPPRCPTCGSEDPKRFGWGCNAMRSDWPHTDPWHAGEPTPEYERSPVEGPSCIECDVTMLLLWEGEGRVSIREAEGWTLVPGHGWRCPDHSAPPAPVQEER